MCLIQIISFSTVPVTVVSFCMPLVDALLTLVRQNYQSFLLTIECSTVYWVAYGKPSRNLCLISWVFLLGCPIANPVEK